MRVVQSVKHTKRSAEGTKLLRDGWMVHYTNRDSTVCTWHYCVTFIVVIIVVIAIVHSFIHSFINVDLYSAVS